MSYKIEITTLEDNTKRFNYANGTSKNTIGNLFVSPTGNCQLSVFGTSSSAFNFMQTRNLKAMVKDDKIVKALQAEFLDGLKRYSTKIMLIDLRQDWLGSFNQIVEYSVQPGMEVKYTSTNNSSMVLLGILVSSLKFK